MKYSNRTITKEEIIEAIDSTNYLYEAAVKLEVPISQLRSLIKRNDISTEKLDFPTEWHDNPNSLDESIIFGINNIPTMIVRKKLGDKIEHKCVVCGLTEWNGKPIMLDVYHKDNDMFDNRIENLAYICPNCRRQSHFVK